MDFVSDQLYDDRRIRVLVIIENYTRECLALEANAKIRGIDVATTLERITRTEGFPKRIKVDNGPEFISKDLDRWAYWNKVELDFSRPGKLSDNALVEAFNSRFRQECLNQHWFLPLEDAKAKLSAWKREYNTERPHSSLGYRTPVRVSQNQPMKTQSQHKTMQKTNPDFGPATGASTDTKSLFCILDPVKGQVTFSFIERVGTSEEDEAQSERSSVHPIRRR